MSEIEIKTLIENTMTKFPTRVVEYRNGKSGLLGLFVGEVMKESKGKADPKLTNKLVIEALK